MNGIEITQNKLIELPLIEVVALSYQIQVALNKVTTERQLINDELVRRVSEYNNDKNKT